MSRAAINNQEDRPLCPNQKPFQKLDEYIEINAAFFLDHKPHVALRGNRREQAHAMPSAGCYHNGRFAFLAPSAPGMMIRADMRRIAKIDVRIFGNFVFSHFFTSDGSRSSAWYN